MINIAEYNFPDNIVMDLAESIKSIDPCDLTINGYRQGLITINSRDYECLYMLTDRGLVYVTNKGMIDKLSVLFSSFPAQSIKIHYMYKDTQYGLAPTFTFY